MSPDQSEYKYLTNVQKDEISKEKGRVKRTVMHIKVPSPDPHHKDITV